MLGKVIGKLRGKTGLGAKLTYEKARDVLEGQAEHAHRDLAKHTAAPPEVLYYLAESGTSPVRVLVAANEATPHKANVILSNDVDDDVRCELARKIARLMPDLDEENRVRMREGMFEVLERLANDHLPRVRQILAEELKSSDRVPYEIVLKLANDAEAVVCVPIIQYSPLLRDEDLLEILATSRVHEVIEAVASRQNVSEPVSDAVVASLDIPAVAALLANRSAQIREQTLDRIIENAAEIDSWHQPLVMRPDLSVRAVRRIAGFVASALLDTLLERHPVEPDLASELKSRMRKRIDKEDMSPDAVDGAKAARDAVEKAKKDGKLNDEFVEEAAIARNRALVTEALQVLSGLPHALVNRIIVSRNGKAVTALTWKAGLAMRTALMIQNHIAFVPRQNLVLAKDGVDYAMSPDEMQWHLEYFMSMKD